MYLLGRLIRGSTELPDSMPSDTCEFRLGITTRDHIHNHVGAWWTPQSLIALYRTL